MKISYRGSMLLAFPLILCAAKRAPEPAIQTSDRRIACHNELTTASGQDVAIGFTWRASIMANSSRDAYWQAGVRRETIDHPREVSHTEMSAPCATCRSCVTGPTSAESQAGSSPTFRSTIRNKTDPRPMV